MHFLYVLKITVISEKNVYTVIIATYNRNYYSAIRKSDIIVPARFILHHSQCNHKYRDTLGTLFVKDL